MKKLSFRIIIPVMIFALIVALTWIILGRGETYTIHITVPAGTMDEFIAIDDFLYSDEEISPQKKQLTLKSIDVPDGTELVLKPIEATEEKAYERTYLYRGQPLLIDVEKGTWFQIGIAMQNPTDKDITVGITVENVCVRIK